MNMQDKEEKPQRDGVDDVVDQWGQRIPDLDAEAMSLVGRLQRTGRFLSLAIAQDLAQADLEPWEFDVLATLYRGGKLTASELARSCMVTSGAITNRVDRLVRKGFVSRRTSPSSRRTTLIDLTEEGKEATLVALEGHLKNLDSLVSVLSTKEKIALNSLLHGLLISLGDVSTGEPTSVLPDE